MQKEGETDSDKKSLVGISDVMVSYTPARSLLTPSSED
jgi:hypothetical protein